MAVPAFFRMRPTSPKVTISSLRCVKQGDISMSSHLVARVLTVGSFFVSGA